MCCVASADLETSGTGFIEEEEEFAKVDPVRELAGVVAV